MKESVINGDRAVVATQLSAAFERGKREGPATARQATVRMG